MQNSEWRDTHSSAVGKQRIAMSSTKNCGSSVIFLVVLFSFIFLLITTLLSNRRDTATLTASVCSHGNSFSVLSWQHRGHDDKQTLKLVPWQHTHSCHDNTTTASSSYPTATSATLRVVGCQEHAVDILLCTTAICHHRYWKFTKDDRHFQQITYYYYY